MADINSLWQTFLSKVGFDTNSFLQTREGYAPSYEDNAVGVGVAGTMQKPVVSSTYAPLTYQQAASVTKANIKSTPGNVYSIRLTNANAAVRYFQLHNKTTAPAATDVPQLTYIVPAGTATAPGVLTLSSSDFAPSEFFTLGIGWAVSTTATTFTDSATAADHTTTVRYQ